MGEHGNSGTKAQVNNDTNKVPWVTPGTLIITGDFLVRSYNTAVRMGGGTGPEVKSQRYTIQLQTVSDPEAEGYHPPRETTHRDSVDRL